MEDTEYAGLVDYMADVAVQIEQTPAERMARQCDGSFGRNDDARYTAGCESLMSVAGHVSREYGEYGYRIGQVANAMGGGIFSVRHSDGSTFFLAVDRWGNVARIADEEV